MLASTTKYPIKDKSHGCPNFRNTTKLKYVPTLFFYSREVFIWSQSGALYMQIGTTDWHTQFLLVYFAKKIANHHAQAAMSLHNICLLCSRGECTYYKYMAMSTTNIFEAAATL